MTLTAADRAHVEPREGARAPTLRARLFEAVPVAALLVCAILFGGSDDPLGDMLIEIVAIAGLGWLFVRLDGDEWRAARLGWAAVLATAAVAVLQLAPLPAGLWNSLPGRADAALLYASQTMSPPAPRLTLDPNATLASLIRFIPALAALVATLAAGVGTRRLLGTLIIAGALLNLLFGMGQATGLRQFYLYQNSDYGWVTGLFANHNHTADLFLIAIVLVISRLSVTPRESTVHRMLLVGLAVALSVGTLLTGSRVGIVILLVIVPLQFILLGGFSRARISRTVIMLFVLLAIAGGLTLFSGNAGRSVARFGSLLEDLRPVIWGTTWRAIAEYWPAGSGLGTFVPVYARFEALDTMPGYVVNHAHNEYLELALELGFLFPLIVLPYGVLLVRAALRHLRPGNANAAEIGALAGIVVLLVHSAFEFPLRNEALLVSFAILHGILLSPPNSRGNRA